MDDKVKCLYCGKDYSKQGIKTHIWRSHGEGKGFTPTKGKPPWNKGLNKRNDIRIEKSANTLKNKYKSDGFVNPMKGRKLSDETKEKLSKFGGYKKGSGRGKKGWYKGYWCDSSWELAFIIYNLEHDIIFQRNTQKFEYEFENKIKHYIPDFIMEDGTYIEIKNFDTKMTLAKYKAFPYTLQVLKGKELQPILKYVIDKYGKDFIKLYDGA